MISLKWSEDDGSGVEGEKEIVFCLQQKKQKKTGKIECCLNCLPIGVTLENTWVSQKFCNILVVSASVRHVYHVAEAVHPLLLLLSLFLFTPLRAFHTGDS